MVVGGSCGGGGGRRGHWDEGGGEEVMAHVSESTAVELSEETQVGIIRR